MIVIQFCLVLLILQLRYGRTYAFHPAQLILRRTEYRSIPPKCRSSYRQCLIFLQALQSNDDGLSSKHDKMPYKFGDIARSLTNKLNEKSSQITGKDTYEFGDLSRWADKKAKERIMSIRSKTGEYKYEFGDLSRFADNIVKEQAAKYAGKENATDYQFGDVTKTLLKKVLTGEYDPQDVYLALRILVVAGCALLPIAQLLPLNTLFEMFELGLLRDIGFRLLPIVAQTIDARMKEALTGDANYQLGDLTKQRLRQYLARFIGKETYEFGDVTRSVIERQEHKEINGNAVVRCSDTLLIDDPALYDELVSWDQRYLEQNRNVTFADK
jgi:hypothetical protein